jgi:hypothetical protein
MTPTTGLRLYQNRHASGTTVELNEAYGRYVQVELDDERDNVTEVAVLHVEGGNPPPRRERSVAGSRPC